MENGIPQGSVLSVTLFLIAINTVLYDINTNIKFALYCDDLDIFTTNKNLQNAKENLPDTLYQLEKWSDETGFMFSPEKTIAMAFTRKRKILTYPNLYINNKLMNAVPVLMIY